MGAALLHLGSSYLDGNELRTRALNWSDWLAARTNESVRLGTMHDGQVLVVHHVFRPDNSPQALEVGALLPVHATAMGKVLLAHHPYLAAELGKRELVRFTIATITDARVLTAELERVREQGWASEMEELVKERLRAPPRSATGSASPWAPLPLRGRLNGSARAPRCAAISSPTSARVRGRSRATSEPFRGNGHTPRRRQGCSPTVVCCHTIHRTSTLSDVGSIVPRCPEATRECPRLCRLSAVTFGKTPRRAADRAAVGASPSRIRVGIGTLGLLGTALEKRCARQARWVRMPALSAVVGARASGRLGAGWWGRWSQPRKPPLSDPHPRLTRSQFRMDVGRNPAMWLKRIQNRLLPPSDLAKVRVASSSLVSRSVIRIRNGSASVDCRPRSPAESTGLGIPKRTTCRKWC